MLGCDAIDLLLVVGAALKDLLIYLVVVNLNKSGVNILFSGKNTYFYQLNHAK